MTSLARIPTAQQAIHPLDPLTASELEHAVTVLTADDRAPADPAIVLLRLEPPDKAQVRAHTDGAPITGRHAFAVLYDRSSRTTYDAVVDLDAAAVITWWQVPGVQPAISAHEIDTMPEIVLGDPHARHALHHHGVTDLELVQFDTWTTGNQPLDGPSRRLVRVVAYQRHFPQDNGYAHPTGNLQFVVDLDQQRVTKILSGPVLPIPPVCGNYLPEHTGPHRTDLRPIEVTQPEGPSFTITGHVITWHNWRLHAHIDPVEGLVISDVSYTHAGRRRPILHRAGIAEMVVPYGDPSDDFRFRCAFDTGEYHLGAATLSLRQGCDCLGEIRYLDAVLADHAGQPIRIANAICVHEEDAGILHKHVNYRFSDQPHVRRDRRLIVSAMCTLGNYDYALYWSFHLDGTINVEVKATGILQTRATTPDEPVDHATVLAPGLVAPHHQHLFCMRLDMEIDGPRNTVYELDTIPAPPGPDNPLGNAITVERTPLTSELTARRTTNPATNRSWLISNTPPGDGTPAGYQLVPQPSPALLAAADSPIARRAAFATHHLWVTRHDPTQRHPAGDHPNQHAGGAGLPEWVQADRPLIDTDLVLHHVFGLTHVPSTEEWPIMNAHSTGFSLRPKGFFPHNPVLDTPPSTPHCHPL